MAVATLLSRPGLAVLDYHCTLGPGDTPFVERYENHSVAFVRRGSFGCRSRGRDFELVAGSVLVGYPGDEYLCTHDHAGGGDECLSFHLEPELAEVVGDRLEVWRSGSAPPLPELMVLAELAQAAAGGRSDVSLEEAALLFVSRFHEIVCDRVKIIPDELSQGLNVFLLSGARRPPTFPPGCLEVEGDGLAERC